MKKLHALADALLEKEILESNEIDQVLDGKFKIKKDKKNGDSKEAVSEDKKDLDDASKGKKIDQTV